MKSTRDIMAELIATGLSPEQIVLMAELAAAASAEGARGPEETKEARTKRLAAERQAAKRARDSVTKRDFCVTEPEEVGVTQTVTKRDIVTESHATPRARVRDNPLGYIPLEDITAVVETRDDDWPIGGTKAHLAELVAVAGSHRLDPAKTPGLITTLGRLAAWRRDGASWEHDVVPAVTAMTRKTGPPIQSWKFFDAAIAQSIADNRQALTIPPANDPAAHPNQRQTARNDRLSRMLAGAMAAADEQPPVRAGDQRTGG